MTPQELLEQVAQDSNDYDEDLDGWLLVTVEDGIITVQVEKSSGEKHTARFRAEVIGGEA